MRDGPVQLRAPPHYKFSDAFASIWIAWHSLWHADPTAKKLPPPPPTMLLHYFRTPKTGSSAMLERLLSWETGAKAFTPVVEGVHEYQIGCSQGSVSMKLLVHDHGGGCWDDVCRASALPSGVASLAVLREPCERFASLHDQLSRDRLSAREMVGAPRWVPGMAGHVVEALAAYLIETLAGCAGEDVACAVAAIDRRVKGPSRIFLYPQSLFIAPELANASILCHDHSQLGQRFDRFFSHQMRCEGSGTSATQHYPGSKPRLQFHAMRKVNVGRNWRRRMPKMDEATCAHVRALYARDAQLWSSHCASPLSGR